MMTQDRTISGHQLSVTAFVLMLSPTLRLFPSAAAEQAGRSAPLAALLAFFPAALYLYLVCRAAALRREGEGLCALLARALPGRAGRMALGVLCLWLLAYAGFVLRSGADRFIVAVYPGAPPAFFVLTMAAAALAAAFAPYRDACRTAKLVFPAVGGVLALVLAFRWARSARTICCRCGRRASTSCCAARCRASTCSCGRSSPRSSRSAR